MKDTENALKKIVKGSGIFLIGLVLSKALAYAYRIIIARISVEQYGLFSIALAVFGICTTISLLGMSDGVIRFVSFYKGKSDQKRIKGIITSALKITLPLSLLCAAFLFFASNWIAITFFHNKDLSILLKIVAFGIPLDTLRAIFFSSIKAFQRIEYEVYAKMLAENIAKVILTLIIVHLGFGVVWAAIVYIISIFVSFVLSFYFLEKKVFSITTTKIESISSNKELLFYSFPLLLSGFVYLIIQWTDTLMLGGLKTVSEVGLYNVALPTASLLYVFSSAIRALFFPVLSEIYAQNKKATFESLYKTVTKWILAVNSIIFVFLVVFSYQIIRILFGESYVKDTISFFGTTIPLSVLALIILALGMIPADFLVPAKDVLMVLKKTKLVFLNLGVGSVLNVILNYFLIPSYGIIGAAIATGLAYFVIAMMISVETYFITKINPFKLSCIRIIGAAMFTLVIMILFKVYSINNIVYLIIAGLIFLIVYFGLLLIIRSFDKDDILIVNSILQKLNVSPRLRAVLEKFI